MIFEILVPQSVIPLGTGNDISSYLRMWKCSIYVSCHPNYLCYKSHSSFLPFHLISIYVTLCLSIWLYAYLCYFMPIYLTLCLSILLPFLFSNLNTFILSKFLHIYPFYLLHLYLSFLIYIYLPFMYLPSFYISTLHIFYIHIASFFISDLYISISNFLSIYLTSYYEFTFYQSI